MTSEMTSESSLTLTPRTERQKTAAVLRATRAVSVFDSYCKESKMVRFKAWRVTTFKFVELCETCCARSCTKPAVKRIAINVWGSVTEADVCEDHADRHGKWVDDL
jgi:hypothetical protein